MQKKISLIKLLRRWGLLFVVGTILIIFIADTVNTYIRYKTLEDRIRNEYLTTQKKTVKSEVNRIVELLNIQERQLYDFTKKILETRVDEAEKVAMQIYTVCKQEGKSDASIRRRIINTIRNLKKHEFTDYFFVVDLKGNVLLHEGSPHLTGVNIYSSDKYKESQLIFEKFAETVKDSGEGFVEYYWFVPKQKRRELKITFIKVFKPFNWIIGTGSYVYKSEKILQNNIAQFVNKYRFGKNKNNYIFILRLFDINGGKNFAQMYVNPNRPDLIGKFLHDDYKDAKGKEFRKVFLKGLREKGEAFVKYWYKKPGSDKPAPKISYFKLTDNKEFIVAAGFYLDDMNKEIMAIHKELVTIVVRRFIIMLIAIIVIIVLFLALLNKYLNKLAKDMNVFASFFKNAVKKNKPIDTSEILFEELEPLAEDANRMLEGKNIAEKKLREEKEKLLVTMQSIGDGLISTDSDGKVVFLNRVAEKLTGWTTEEAQGKELDEVFNIINEQTREKAENPVKKVLENGEVVGLANHTLLISRNGEEYNIADSAAPIKDASGKILGVVLVFRDVTEEYRTFRELKRNEEMNSAIINALPDLIITFDKDLTLTSYYANNYTDFYAPPEKFLGKSVYETLPRDIAELTERNVKKVLADNETVSYEYELEVNGENKFFEARLTKKGESEVLVVIRDITEKKKVEQELIAREKQYRQLSLLKKAILESPQGIIVFALDKEYKYLDFTSVHKATMKAIWGVDIEIGKNMLDYIKKEEDRISAKENFDRALRGESFILIEEYGDEKLKRTFYENRYSPVFDDDGNIVGVSVYVIDITERIRAQKLAEKMLIELEEKADELKRKNEELVVAKEKAEASEKLKTEFLAQVSHEIRTPLNVIINYISLIQAESETDDEFINTSFSVIESASRRIIRTIELIINMSELQLGTYSSKKKEFDVVDVLNKVRQEYQSSAEVKKLDFTLEIDSDRRIVNNDDYAFYHTVTNLVDNAIKYTNAGYVKIKVKKTSDKLLIIVEDTGIGISEEYLPKLFEPFSQEEQGYHRSFDGTGLGMAIIKGYTEMMGARIFVESEKGKGTAFTIELDLD